MKLLSFLGAVFACAPLSANGANVPGNAYDHIKSQYIPEGIRWLEVGFFAIVESSWTPISVTYTNFTDPVVFLSLPNLAGETSTTGTSMSLRVRNTKLTYIDHDTKTFDFEARSYSVNDTYCTQRKVFYTPAEFVLPSSFIGWLAVERGMFNVSHKAFIIQTDNINRTNVNDSTDPRNQFKSFAPNGVCNMGQNCRLNIIPTYLTIAQLQTTRYERFLLLRAIGTGRRFVVYVLVPHDSLSNANFYIPSPGEDYAWMLFEPNLKVTCVENLIMETYTRKVTYLKTTLTYANVFTVAPAVFGMVQTYIGRDSLGLRAFNLGTTSADFITQEDKCTDAETQHTTEEDAALIVIGRAAAGTTVCGATFIDSRPTLSPTASPVIAATEPPTAVPSSYPTANPTFRPSSVPSAQPSTSAPSAAPTATPTVLTNETWCTHVTLYDTFGDGWGPDIALKISLDEYSPDSSILEPLYIYYVCPESAPKEFCWQDDEKVSFDIVSLNPPAKETWEIYWTVNWVVPNTIDETYLGDYDTTMDATKVDFNVYDGVDFHNETCDRCKHPPKPPAKRGPGVGKGSTAGDDKSTRDGSSGASVGSTGPKPGASDSESAPSSGFSESTDSASNTSSVSADSGAGGKGKPKPHWPFPISLYDTNGDGWFNASDSWTQVPARTSGGGVYFPDGRALPETLTYPEYIISTIDRVNAVRRNTICGALLKEDCEERLPDAKYIFRVTGDLSKWDTENNSFWKFCGKKGTAREELEFKLIHGKCFPGKKISADDICFGDATASFNGILTLHNVATVDLTEFDTAVLESDIAEGFSSKLGGLEGSISLNSWSVSDNNLVILFSMKFSPAKYGMSGMYSDEMEALQSSLTSSAEAFTGSGQFLSFVQSSLMYLPLGSNDVLESMTGAEISDVTFVDNSFGGVSVVSGDRPTGSLSATSVVDNGAHDQKASELVLFEQSAVVLFAALVALAVAFTVYRSIKPTHEQTLPTESSRELLTEETGNRDVSRHLSVELPPSF